jgi:hypothetical protein
MRRLSGIGGWTGANLEGRLKPDRKNQASTRLLRVRASHEGGRFMPHLDKIDPVRGAVQCAENLIDAIARIAEDAFDATFGQTAQ